MFRQGGFSATRTGVVRADLHAAVLGAEGKALDGRYGRCRGGVRVCCSFIRQRLEQAPCWQRAQRVSAAAWPHSRRSFARRLHCYAGARVSHGHGAHSYCCCKAQPHRKRQRGADQFGKCSIFIRALWSKHDLLHLHRVAVAQVACCCNGSACARRRYRQAERAAAVFACKQPRSVPACSAGAGGTSSEHAARFFAEQNAASGVQAAFPVCRYATERRPARGHRVPGSEAHERHAAKQLKPVGGGVELRQPSGAGGGQVQRAARQQQLHAAGVGLQLQPLRHGVGGELCQRSFIRRLRKRGKRDAAPSVAGLKPAHAHAEYAQLRVALRKRWYKARDAPGQRTVRSRRSCGPSTAAPGSAGSHSSTRRPLRASSRAVARANAPPPSTATSNARRLPRRAGSTSAAAQRVAAVGARRKRRHAVGHCGEHTRAAATGNDGHAGGATQPACCSTCIAALPQRTLECDRTVRVSGGKRKGRVMVWALCVRFSSFLVREQQHRCSGRCSSFVQRIVERRERLNSHHRRIDDGCWLARRRAGILVICLRAVSVINQQAAVEPQDGAAAA